MGAAAILEKKFKDPAYRAAYKEQEKKLGGGLKADEKTLLETRLLANPDKVRLRVYQTNSTHKSMSCLRQGSMVLVKDQDYHSVQEQFHEAVFTHASTSLDPQIIATLDVARRQIYFWWRLPRWESKLPISIIGKKIAFQRDLLLRGGEQYEFSSRDNLQSRHLHRYKPDLESRRVTQM
jgi:hypothetical protein